MTNNVSQSYLEEYISSHCIDFNYLKNDNFDDFMKGRADKLLDLIEKAMGKKISDRNALYELLL